MDLSTTFMGLGLPHPFMAGAGPMADTLDSARRMEDAGAAALVMRSLFEEQINAEALATYHTTEAHSETFGEALSYLPEPEEFVLGPEEYLERLRRTKEALGIPVMASLGGYTPGGWLDYAKLMQETGADAIELNLYYVATNPEESAGDLEDRAIEMIRTVKQALRVPLGVKLSPFYTSMAHFARRLAEAGADGLVLFNRYYESDLDVEELEVQPRLTLSDSRELLLRLRWLAIISANLPGTSLAVTGGVHTAQDAIKAIMCGASAIQMVSAILSGGPGRIGQVHREVAEWMEEREYESLQQMRGSMDLKHCPDPASLSRANYMRMLQTWRQD